MRKLWNRIKNYFTKPPPTNPKVDSPDSELTPVQCFKQFIRNESLSYYLKKGDEEEIQELRVGSAKKEEEDDDDPQIVHEVLVGNDTFVPLDEIQEEEHIQLLLQMSEESEALRPNRAKSSYSQAIINNIVAECPICFEILLPSIYLCVNGHSVCGSCKPKISFCPLCKLAMSETRNYAMENLVNNSDFVCDNERCKEVINGADMKDHMKKCRFIKPSRTNINETDIYYLSR